MPAVTKGGKFFYEVCPQQRLATAEGDTAAGGPEIKIIDLHPVVLLLSRQQFPFGVLREGEGIDAPFAPQGTAVKADERGDAIAVGLHPQPGAGNDRGFYGTCHT